MAFEENNPGFWEYEKDGDSIMGVLIKIEDDVGSNSSKLYTLEVDTKPTNVWGSVILDQRMVGIKVGDLVKIVYKGLGEAKAGHNAPKIFQVLVDRNPGTSTPATSTPEQPEVSSQIV